MMSAKCWPFFPGFNVLKILFKLEQLERLRSEDTPRRLMITHTIESYWISSQNESEKMWKIEILEFCYKLKMRHTL